MTVTVDNVRKAVNEYLDAAKPKNLMFVNIVAAESMLRGFSVALSSGVAIWYSAELSEKGIDDDCQMVEACG